MTAQSGIRTTASVDDRISAAFQSIGKEARQMAQSFEKSTGAVKQLAGAAGSMGGEFGEAGAKISGLISAIAMGGPLGIGVVALTAGVAALTAAWMAYRQEQELVRLDTEMTARAVGAVLNRDLAQQMEATKAAETALRNYGKTSRQVRVEELEASAEAIARNIKANTDWSRSETDILHEKMKKREFMLRELEALKGLEDSEHKTASAAESASARKVRAREQAAAAAREEKRMLDEIAAATEAWGRQQNELLERETQAQNAKLRSELDHFFMVREVREEALARQKQADEEQIARDNEAFQRNAMVAQQIADVYAASFTAVIDGNETAGKAVAKATVASAEIAIKAALQVAMAEQIKAASPFGVAGIAIGMAAAGIVAKLIMNNLSSLPKAAGGGVVGEGIGGRGVAGRDSVPILTMPGEGILPVSLVRQLRQVLGMPSGPSAAGGGVATRGGGMPMQVELKLSSVVPPNDLQLKEAALVIGDHIRDLWARGY